MEAAVRCGHGSQGFWKYIVAGRGLEICSGRERLSTPTLRRSQSSYLVNFFKIMATASGSGNLKPFQEILVLGQ